MQGRDFTLSSSKPSINKTPYLSITLSAIDVLFYGKRIKNKLSLSLIKIVSSLHKNLITTFHAVIESNLPAMATIGEVIDFRFVSFHAIFQLFMFLVSTKPLVSPISSLFISRIFASSKGDAKSRSDTKLCEIKLLFSLENLKL